MTDRTIVIRPALLALAAALAAPVWAANECKVEYGYWTGSGINRQDKTETVNLNAGQTLSVNRSNLNFVRNTGDNKVDVKLKGAANNHFTLDKNQRNPTALFYATPTTLESLLCTHGATVSAPSTPQQLVNQLKQAGTSVNQIAQQLKTTFNQTGAQVAALLQAAGYSASQVAAALASAFNATGAQVAAWLKAAGYTGEQVAAALKAQFNASASQAAGWLKDAFNATGAQVTAWLKAAGYTGEQIAAALKAQFNATAAQAAGWLKEAFNATGEQVAAWLKAAAYTGEQVAAALKAQFNATAAQAAQWLQSAFSATTQQLAQWLRSAGYTLVQVAQALEQLNLDPAQAMAAVRQAFNASWTEVVNAYNTFADALRPTNCGAAGCNQGAQLLQAAGAAAAEALKALKDAYGLTEAAALQIARNVFGLTGQAIDAALAAAGYVGRQANRVVAESMTIKYVLHGSAFTSCNNYPGGTRIYGVGGSAGPLPLPATGTPQAITFIGNAALAAASAINDLPAGTRYTIRSRGSCYFIADITVPTTAAQGVSGRGVLMSASQPGAGFDWRVGPVPASTTPIFVQPPAARSPLQTRIDETTLYKVGSGTTTDANGDNYTLLEKNASHCQNVAAPSPPYTSSGAQNASRAVITVPNIAWTVTNSGTSAVNGVTAELVRGSTVLATQPNLNVAAGQTLNFSTPRPQNQTCVAKVGGGGECYHCGQRHEGWRDNDVFVRIR